LQSPPYSSPPDRDAPRQNSRQSLSVCCGDATPLRATGLLPDCAVVLSWWRGDGPWFARFLVLFDASEGSETGISQIALRGGVGARALRGVAGGVCDSA